MYETLREALTRTLLEHGWSREAFTAIASKDYATVVGTKQAHAYLGRDQSSDPNLVLKGEYYSEGRNVLEPRSVLIPKASSVEAATQLAQAFAAGVDERIAQTYAVRLLRS